MIRLRLLHRDFMHNLHEHPAATVLVILGIVFSIWVLAAERPRFMAECTADGSSRAWCSDYYDHLNEHQGF